MKKIIILISSIFILGCQPVDSIYNHPNSVVVAVGVRDAGPTGYETIELRKYNSTTSEYYFKRIVIPGMEWELINIGDTLK